MSKNPEDAIDWDATIARTFKQTPEKRPPAPPKKKTSYPRYAPGWARDREPDPFLAVERAPAPPPPSPPQPDEELELSGVLDMDEVTTRILRHLTQDLDTYKDNVVKWRDSTLVEFQGVQTKIRRAQDASNQLDRRIATASKKLVRVEGEITKQAQRVTALEVGPKARPRTMGFLMGLVLAGLVGLAAAASAVALLAEMWTKSHGF